MASVICGYIFMGKKYEIYKNTAYNHRFVAAILKTFLPRKNKNEQIKTKEHTYFSSLNEENRTVFILKFQRVTSIYNYLFHFNF